MEAMNKLSSQEIEELDFSNGFTKFKMDFSESFGGEKSINSKDAAQFFQNVLSNHKGDPLEPLFYVLSEYHKEKAESEPDAKVELNIPVSIGSCGTCGCDRTRVCRPICVYITCWCGLCW